MEYMHSMRTHTKETGQYTHDGRSLTVLLIAVAILVDLVRCSKKARALATCYMNDELESLFFGQLCLTAFAPCSWSAIAFTASGVR